METIAVYEEERIKVYTIHLRQNLIFATLSFPACNMEKWADAISRMAKESVRCELFTFENPTSKKAKIKLIFQNSARAGLEQILLPLILKVDEESFHVREPVEMLYLHGPHFQDRYGIIDVAASGLAKDNIYPIIWGCTGTSIYLVSDKGDGEKIELLLNKIFLIPTQVG